MLGGAILPLDTAFVRLSNVWTALLGCFAIALAGAIRFRSTSSGRAAGDGAYFRNDL